MLLVLFLVSKAAAQGYVDILPDEVKNPFQERYQSISKALAQPAANEWSGDYLRDPGPTWDEFLVWEPKLGFAAFRDTCSNGPRAWVNYGAAIYRDGALTLLPERGTSAEFVLNFPDKEFTPIKWGEQHWLVPTKNLTLFAYAINSRSGEVYSIGYLKRDDREKAQSKRPDLPPQYLKLLGLPAIKASVVEVGKGPGKWYPDLTINAGRNKGVIEGLSFWLIGKKGIDVEAYVSEVRERTAVVRVILAGRTADFEKEIVPVVGWRLTSRMPSKFIKP